MSKTLVKSPDSIIDTTHLDVSDAAKVSFVTSFTSLEAAHSELKKTLELAKETIKSRPRKAKAVLN